MCAYVSTLYQQTCILHLNNNSSTDVTDVMFFFIRIFICFEFVSIVLPNHHWRNNDRRNHFLWNGAQTLYRHFQRSILPVVRVANMMAELSSRKRAINNFQPNWWNFKWINELNRKHGILHLPVIQIVVRPSSSQWIVCEAYCFTQNAEWSNNIFTCASALFSENSVLRFS